MPPLLCISPYRKISQASQDLSWANVALLLHGDGTNGSTTILDEVGNKYTSSGATTWIQAAPGSIASANVGTNSIK